MAFPKGIKKPAVLCVLKNAERFLLLKRRKEPNKNMFTPLGGKIDPFENPYAAALRETYEETGIRVPEMRYCGSLVETSPAKYNWISFVYLAEIAYQSPPDCPEGVLEWIAVDDLLKVPTPPADWHIYKYLLERKPFAFNADYDAEINLLSMTEEIENVKVC